MRRSGQHPPRVPRTRAHGFTLMEALIAAAVLAFSVAALTHAIVAGQMQTYDAIHASRAVALAEAMMEEVLAKPYDDPTGELTFGPEAGETTRQLYDNIDDYADHTETAGALADPEGNVYPDLFQAFTRSVAVAADTVDVAAFGAVQNGLRVTVTVQEPDGRAWTIERFVPEPSE